MSKSVKIVVPILITASIVLTVSGCGQKNNKIVAADVSLSSTAEVTSTTVISNNQTTKVKPTESPAKDKFYNFVVETEKSNLSIRSGPGTAFDRIGFLRRGTKLHVSRIIGGWGHIEYKGGNGYVSMKYLKPLHDIISVSYPPKRISSANR